MNKGDTSMAGGFFSGTPGSQAATGEKKSAQRVHNVMPVTIKDILDSPDEKLKIEDAEVHMVTFVGTVEAIESKQNNISYKIRDDSGEIEVIQWIEEGTSPSAITVVEGNFCRVIGSIRHTQDRRHIMAFRVAPLTTANEITNHLLETHYIKLKLRQLKSKTGGTSSYGNAPNAQGGGPLASFSNNAGGNAVINGLSKYQETIYSTIQACMSETGMEKSQIYNSVKGKITQRDVDAALEFLCSEGHIYSTIDEDHFKSTDS